MAITKERAIKVVDAALRTESASDVRGVVAALDKAGAFDAPKPAGLMTRARAEAAVDAAYGGAPWPKDQYVVRFVLNALADAGAFGDEATLAEIDMQSRTIIADAGAIERGGTSFAPRLWRTAALRLANACREAGLVKG